MSRRSPRTWRYRPRLAEGYASPHEILAVAYEGWMDLRRSLSHALGPFRTHSTWVLPQRYSSPNVRPALSWLRVALVGPRNWRRSSTAFGASVSSCRAAMPPPRTSSASLQSLGDRARSTAGGGISAVGTSRKWRHILFSSAKSTKSDIHRYWARRRP